MFNKWIYSTSTELWMLRACSWVDKWESVTMKTNRTRNRAPVLVIWCSGAMMQDNPVYFGPFNM